MSIARDARLHAARRALRSPATLLFDDPEAGTPLHTGRLGAVLYTAGFVDVAVTSPFLPSTVDHRVVYLLVAAAGITALVMALLPWARIPVWAQSVPVLWAFVLLGIGGYYGSALDHFQAFYPLAFLFIGLTQPPGRSAIYAVPASASALVSVAGRQPAGDLLDLVGAILVGVVLGELLSQLAVRHRTSRRSVEDLLGAVTALNSVTDQEAALDTLERLTGRLLDAVGGLALLHVPDDGNLAAQAIRNRRPLFVPHTSVLIGTDASTARRLQAKSLVYVPLLADAGAPGVVIAWWRSPHLGLTDYQEKVAAVLGRQAGEALTRLRSVDRLEEQARTDALTGLANRRTLVDELSRLPIDGTVVMFDLDHFKQLNDARGHEAGDHVLRMFADTLQTCVRDGDCAARYGGEEFALVLHGGGERAAEATLERVRRRWHDAGAPRTWSAGVAARRIGDSPASTMARADAAMYEAKRAGRDRTVVSGRVSV